MNYTEPLAIYRRPGKFIVKRHEGPVGLWSVLGPAYTREMAETLADKLTQEMEELKREAKARR